MKATNYDRVFNYTFALIYPLYVTKIEKKGRTIEELNKVIEWLTGYDSKKLKEIIDSKITLKQFFNNANINPNSSKITGLICGVRVEDIEDKLMQQIRYMDKIVDELAKGKSLEKIMRE